MSFSASVLKGRSRKATVTGITGADAVEGDTDDDDKDAVPINSSDDEVEEEIATAKIATNGNSDSDSDGLDEINKETEEEKKAREEAEQKAREELENIQIKPGDYQIQVHIIECRDLKGEDASGSCDPVVIVKVGKEKQSTKVKKQTSTCVFDDLVQPYY